MLCWQLYSNLSDPLICWYNEIVAYLIYHVVFSCHLLVYKNKLSLLFSAAMGAQQGSDPCPSPLLDLLLSPRVWPPPSAAHRWSLVTWRASMQNLMALAQHPPPVLPFCGSPGTFRCPGLWSQLMQPPVGGMLPQPPCPHTVKLVGAGPGAECTWGSLGMAPGWGCRGQGYPWSWAQGLEKLHQPGQALSPAPGAGRSPTEEQGGSHRDECQLGHVHEHSLRCICFTTIWLSHRNIATWCTTQEHSSRL